ncbi:MAG TPA: PIN domain-containing protein [Candidatus Nanoarchaeia archaeon]|nr:PIN domain-containing protein [Candidatus Nanoarchaeia archaeon]
MNTDSKILLDSNILVYSEDRRYPERQMKAIEFLDKCGEERIGVLSIQNLAEFSNVLFIKVKNLSSHDINERIRDLSIDFELIHYNINTLIKANDYYERFKTDFFDALLAATMEENNIHIIATENVDHFKSIPWIIVINPFKEEKSRLNR